MNKFDALKDNDSGDHDQNEENSTQKDGEREKTERDKSQGSSKRKAVVPGPAEHPLQYNYTFWRTLFQYGKRLPVTQQPQPKSRIRRVLRRVLNLPPNTIMEYKTHTNSIKMPGSLGPQRLLLQNLWKLRLNTP
ncbi:eukaryotic translation initiation [Lynx pardinus]|uniref:Eukaryotic translation initiation n=1 Tax=Lynx pardinus TaxID=191816 RepID=A0A485MDP8_LYNPA|nr:eukaryotic translation initiation [Lynx pardinus]